MNNIKDIPIALVAGPRCGSGSVINYFVEVHGYNFEYCDIPVYKPKTIYLLRDTAKFNRMYSYNYNKIDKWIKKFIKLANNDEIHTIALIRHPIQQLLSIYHKIIENGGKYDEIKLSASTNFEQFLCYMQYNSIIYQSMNECKDIINVEELFSTTNGLNLKLMTIKNISGNRGIDFFMKHDLISNLSLNKVQNSESNDIYKLLTQKKITKPL